MKNFADLCLKNLEFIFLTLTVSHYKLKDLKQQNFYDKRSTIVVLCTISVCSLQETLECLYIKD